MRSRAALPRRSLHRSPKSGAPATTAAARLHRRGKAQPPPRQSSPRNPPHLPPARDPSPSSPTVAARRWASHPGCGWWRPRVLAAGTSSDKADQRAKRLPPRHLWARDLLRVAKQVSAGTTTLASLPLMASPTLHPDESIADGQATPPRRRAVARHRRPDRSGAPRSCTDAHPSRRAPTPRKAARRRAGRPRRLP